MATCTRCGKEIKYKNMNIQGRRCAVCGDWYCLDCVNEEMYIYSVQNCNYVDMVNTVYLCNSCEEKHGKRLDELEKLSTHLQIHFNTLLKKVSILKHASDFEDFTVTL